jgi:hypothetical protein
VIKPFFPPIHATFAQPIGPEISDADLLHAWAGVTVAEIAELSLRPAHPTGSLWYRKADIREEAKVLAVRRRVIALKEAAHEA